MRSLTLLPLLLSAAIGISHASPADDAAIAREIDAALLRLADRGPIADATISRPSRTRYELGAVIDVRAADPKGLAVLAITPGGSAARMGLRRGDRLMRVNGTDAANARKPSVALVESIAGANGRVDLQVRRGSKTIALSGQAERIVLPAYSLQMGVASAAAADADSGCGRISTFDALPRHQRLFPVVVIAIDGRTPPTTGESVRLPAGHHRLVLADKIDGERFNAVQLKQRDNLGRTRYKALEIDVVAGNTYQLAAKLQGPERMRIAGGAYWSPVVSRVIPEPCH